MNNTRQELQIKESNIENQNKKGEFDLVITFQNSSSNDLFHEWLNIYNFFSYHSSHSMVMEKIKETMVVKLLELTKTFEQGVELWLSSSLDPKIILNKLEELALTHEQCAMICRIINETRGGNSSDINLFMSKMVSRMTKLSVDFKEWSCARSWAVRYDSSEKVTILRKMVKLATTFEEWKVIFGCYPEKMCNGRRIALDKMVELAVTFKEWDHVVFSANYYDVKKVSKIALAKMASLAVNFSHWFQIVVRSSNGSLSKINALDKMVEMAKNINDWEVVLSWSPSPNSKWGKIALKNIEAIQK